MKDFHPRFNKGNFDHFMRVSSQAKTIINWWVIHLHTFVKLVTRKSPDLVLFTDSSWKGWGAFDKSADSRTGGQWSTKEQQLHIHI